MISQNTIRRHFLCMMTRYTNQRTITVWHMDTMMLKNISMNEVRKTHQTEKHGHCEENENETNTIK